jgi:hypothetical protein
VTTEANEVKPETETKEQTPETPVTEPITNGSNTPDSPKVETSPPVIEAVPVTVPESENIEKLVESEPEKLAINGLSLEEPKSVAPEVAQLEECKPEESPVDTTETTSAIEIPVQKEVCVDQMPLIESMPPPLPANPPPSSVVSFAATTMAPDLTDASLANTAETAISTPTVLDTKSDLLKEYPTEAPPTIVTNNEVDSSPILTNQIEDKVKSSIEKVKEINEKVDEKLASSEVIIEKLDSAKNDMHVENLNEMIVENIENLNLSEASQPIGDLPLPPLVDDNIVLVTENNETVGQLADKVPDANIINSNFSNGDIANGIDKLILNGNDVIEQENFKNKAVDSHGNIVEIIECNGNANAINMDTKEDSIDSRQSTEEVVAKAASPEESLPPSPSEAEAGAASDSFPAPPSELCRSPQDASPLASPEPEPDAPEPQVNTAV